MPRKSKAATPEIQLDLFNVMEYRKTAPCVPLIRKKVAEWKAADYPGASATTKILLNHWFATDHRLPNGQPFTYHSFQQEAIESLIYVYEIAGIKTRKELYQTYISADTQIELQAYDEFARFCTKMATGSGKTKVMSMAVIWQYFNAVCEDSERFAKTSLLIAPNVIVFERLRSDFEGGRIFRIDPLIPRELEIFWDFDCIMRGDTERASTEGCLYLTNIQQLYEHTDRKNGDEPDIMTAVLGIKPKPEVYSELATIRQMLQKRDGQLLVINDEGHHTHEEESEWNQAIHNLHEQLPLSAQLDFSATPRYSNGTLFPWVISDYPIKQAIIDRVVKWPVKGIAHFEEAHSDDASIKYQGFLTAGVERWREYRDLLAKTKKKPILFIMMNTKDEAEQVGNWLQNAYTSEFGGDKTLIIHTDIKGEVSKKDVEVARKIAREADIPDCPVNAIVSVLMLREGWDVQNVTVVVGLRPYTAAANILPEQAIGRGLRLMFRGEGNGYQERVDIIGNKKFIEYVDRLEQLEDLQLETADVKDKLRIDTIQPVIPEKAAYDLALPKLSPILVRKKSLAEEIESLDVARFRFSPDPLPKKPSAEDIKSFKYTAFDAITMEELFEREYQIQQAQTPQEIVAYYARLIASVVKLPSQFIHLGPKIWEFFETRAFGTTVNMYDPLIMQAMNHKIAAYVVTSVFANMLREKIVEQREPELEGEPRKLSQLEPFPYSRPVHLARKCG